MDESTYKNLKRHCLPGVPLAGVSDRGHCALARQAPYPPPPAFDPSSANVEKPVPPPKRRLEANCCLQFSK